MAVSPKQSQDVILARHDERFKAIEALAKATHDESKDNLKDAIEYNKRSITIISCIFGLVALIGTVLGGIVTIRNDRLRSEFLELSTNLGTQIESKFASGEERIAKALGESRNRDLAIVEPIDPTGGATTAIAISILDNGKTQFSFQTHYRITAAASQSANYEGSLAYYEGPEFIDIMKQDIGFIDENIVLILTAPFRIVERSVLITEKYPSRGQYSITNVYFECEFAVSKAEALMKLSSPTFLHIRPVLPDYEGTPPFYKLPLKFIRGFEPDICERERLRMKK